MICVSYMSFLPFWHYITNRSQVNAWAQVVLVNNESWGENISTRRKNSGSWIIFLIRVTHTRSSQIRVISANLMFCILFTPQDLRKKTLHGGESKAAATHQREDATLAWWFQYASIWFKILVISCLIKLDWVRLMSTFACILSPPCNCDVFFSRALRVIL